MEKAPAPKKIDPAYIAKNLLSTPPAAMDHKVDAKLGDKVIYLGNDVDTDTLAPGGKVKMVHYWKVIAPPGPSWRVFAHVVGEHGEWMNVDYTDMRSGYPPNKWKAGDIIRDEQTFTLKKDWKSSFAEMRMGLYRKGGQGVGDRMAVTSGPKDSERRVVAIHFTVSGKGASHHAGYTIRHATGPITIDGKGDDAAWQSAPKSPAFTTAEGGRELSGTTTARLLWDETNLYALIEVADTDVFTPLSGHDDDLWKYDVVELFIDADRSGAGYVELQVNPKNAQFDAFFPQTRAQPSDKKWNAGMTSAVVVDGSVDDRDDKDRGYTAEIAIPLAAVRGTSATMKVNTPPAVGDRWRLNVVRVDGARGDDHLSAATWNPITIGDFHALGRMLTVTFGDDSGKTVAPATEAEKLAPPEEAAAKVHADEAKAGSGKGKGGGGKGTVGRTGEDKGKEGGGKGTVGITGKATVKAKEGSR